MMDMIEFQAGGEPRPRWRKLAILAQDPAVHDKRGILRTTVQVPHERLEPGPRGHRFHVVDYDATRNVLRPQVDLDRLTVPAKDGDLIVDAAFRCQNVYAVAAHVLNLFESGLGRRIRWAFGGHQLYLVPAAFEEANAYYDSDAQSILFGYFTPAAGGDFVYTSLSTDVIAHETTHAILDGLRPRFEEPGLPDQAAFHEAFADIVALLSAFSLPDLVDFALGPMDREGLIHEGQVSPDALRHSILLSVAEQMGEATTAQRGAALRRSVTIEPFTGWKKDPNWEECHLRGEILVAAVMRTFLDIWTNRLKALKGGGKKLDRERAAEEGVKAASQLLSMCIRALDYLAAVELEYADFLDAILVSDTEAVPDDDRGYRDSLRLAFNGFGIFQPKLRIVEVSGVNGGLVYDSLHFDELRSRRDEVYRFIWENHELLDIAIDQYLLVEDVQPAARLAADGFVVHEVVARYIQMVEGTLGEVVKLARDRGATFKVPAKLSLDTPINLLGGGVLIFDQFGRAKFHQRKDLFDWERQSRRLDYLYRNRLVDSRGRYGFSLGVSEGERFAAVHQLRSNPEEAW